MWYAKRFLISLPARTAPIYCCSIFPGMVCWMKMDVYTWQSRTRIRRLYAVQPFRQDTSPTKWTTPAPGGRCWSWTAATAAHLNAAPRASPACASGLATPLRAPGSDGWCWPPAMPPNTPGRGTPSSGRRKTHFSPISWSRACKAGKRTSTRMGKSPWTSCTIMYFPKFWKKPPSRLRENGPLRSRANWSSPTHLPGRSQKKRFLPLRNSSFSACTQKG